MSDLSTLDDVVFGDEPLDDDFLDELVAAESSADPSFAEGLADIARRQEILRVLVAQRRSRGISQKSVANAMGTTQSAVSDLEGGGNDFYLSTLQRYARAVGGCLELGVHFRGQARRSMAPSVAHVFTLGWQHADARDSGYAATVQPVRRAS